jgi:hypothetical protein
MEVSTLRRRRVHERQAREISVKEGKFPYESTEVRGIVFSAMWCSGRQVAA